MTVLEDGGKYYMCCTGGGMWVSDDLTTFAEKPTHLFGFNPMHVWERYGEMNINRK